MLHLQRDSQIAHAPCFVDGSWHDLALFAASTFPIPTDRCWQENPFNAPRLTPIFLRLNLLVILLLLALDGSLGNSV